MARTETVNVNGQEFTLQSVSPTWYYNHNDRCGMTTDKKDTVRYIDGLFKNVVIAPANVAHQGIKAFEEMEDIETPELLIREIENFLRPGKQSGGRKASSAEE